MSTLRLIHQTLELPRLVTCVNTSSYLSNTGVASARYLCQHRVIYQTLLPHLVTCVNTSSYLSNTVVVPARYLCQHIVLFIKHWGCLTSLLVSTYRLIYQTLELPHLVTCVNTSSYLSKERCAQSSHYQTRDNL